MFSYIPNVNPSDHVVPPRNIAEDLDWFPVAPFQRIVATNLPGAGDVSQFEHIDEAMMYSAQNNWFMW